jgi:hypothetical protein
MGLGMNAGAEDIDLVYQVLPGGLASGLYWIIASGLVGMLTGAAAGGRAADRVMGGALYSRLLGQVPLPQSRNTIMAVAMLMAGAGFIVGSNVGLFAGSVYGGLAAVVPDGIPPGDIWTWVMGGAAVGFLFAWVFTINSWYQPSLVLGLEAAPAGTSLQPLTLVLLCLGGAAGGAALGALEWAVEGKLGGTLFWTLAGASVGGIVGAKLWSMAERRPAEREM